MPSAKRSRSHRLVVDLGANWGKLGGHRRGLDDVAAEIMQNVELVDGKLRKRPTRRLGFVPAPRVGGELERALVGEIGLHESDATEFAGVDCLTDAADAAQQPRAMADRDGDAVFLFQPCDLDAVLERGGDRLLGIDVLAGFGDLGRDRQVLFVRNRDDYSADFRVGQQRFHVWHGRDAEFLLEGATLILGTAVAGDDFELVRFRYRPGEHLGPAAEPHNAELCWFTTHAESFSYCAVILWRFCRYCARNRSGAAASTGPHYCPF